MPCRPREASCAVCSASAAERFPAPQSLLTAPDAQVSDERGFLHTFEYAIAHRSLLVAKASIGTAELALQLAFLRERIPDIGPDRDPEAHVAGNAAADRPQQERDRGQDSHGQPAEVQYDI